MANKNGFGVLYAVLAYSLWGILPLYWKMIDNVNSTEILAHRIIWALFFVSILLTCNKKWGEIKDVIGDKKSTALIGLASVAITINWGVYIWAVNSDHVIEASLGYYINPLVIVLLGVIFFKEKLNLWQITSLLMALIGTAILTIQYGKIPWISFILAFSFAIYGALKKYVKVSSFLGLAMETAIITPFALIFLILRQLMGVGSIGSVPGISILLLIGGGAVTAIPMLLFAKGAKRIPMSTLGFTQYISPTLSLLLGVFVFHEDFTRAHAFSFGFIWCGLLIYSISQTRLVKGKKIFNKEAEAL